MILEFSCPAGAREPISPTQLGAVVGVGDRGNARRSLLVVSDHYVYVL